MGFDGMLFIGRTILAVLPKCHGKTLKLHYENFLKIVSENGIDGSDGRPKNYEKGGSKAFPAKV